MLVVPDDLAGVRVEGQRGVVVEVLVLGPAEHELRGGRSDGGADVDEVQFGVVARHHPGADVDPFLERHAAPALVARLSGPGNQAPPPQLFSRHRVVGDHDARVRPAAWRATAARDDLAVGDDRPRALRGRIHPVVENLRLPHHLAGHRIERVDVVVDGRIDNQTAVDRDVAVVAGERAEQVLADVVRNRAAMLPDEIAGHRVDRLDDVVGVRHVQHAVVGERSARLEAFGQPSRPDHAQIADVVDVDLVQRAVAPAVQRAPPGQPVAVGRLLQHGVGDGREVVAGLCGHGRRIRHQRQCQRQDDGRTQPDPPRQGKQGMHGSNSSSERLQRAQLPLQA